jgi:hypothetical protein
MIFIDRNSMAKGTISLDGTGADTTNPGDLATVSAHENLFPPKDSPILHPNPTTERIRFKKPTQETLLAIYSSSGKSFLKKSSCRMNT